MGPEEQTAVELTNQKAVATECDSSELNGRGTCLVLIPNVSAQKIRSCIVRWNRRWVGGDQFAKEYSAALAQFSSDVRQAVMRLHPLRHCPTTREIETNAVIWAAVLVAFEAASFRDSDRVILQAALLVELRERSGTGETQPLADQAVILERAMSYFALRDPNSQIATAARLVKAYLRAVGFPEPVAATAIARHLRATFGHWILRDIYRLSAASKLRVATVALAERRKLA